MSSSGYLPSREDVEQFLKEYVSDIRTFDPKTDEGFLRRGNSILSVQAEDLKVVKEFIHSDKDFRMNKTRLVRALKEVTFPNELDPLEQMRLLRLRAQVGEPNAVVTVYSVLNDLKPHEIRFHLETWSMGHRGREPLLQQLKDLELAGGSIRALTETAEDEALAGAAAYFLQHELQICSPKMDLLARANKKSIDSFWYHVFSPHKEPIEFPEKRCDPWELA
jgi:hypothetical protein